MLAATAERPSQQGAAEPQIYSEAQRPAQETGRPVSNPESEMFDGLHRYGVWSACVFVGRRGT
jgi:hypothetical protein